MKKALLMLCFVLGVTQFTQAQVDFGIKAGINYNSDSFKLKGVQEDVFKGAESKTGYHAGIWTRFNLPVVGLYIRPELVYTALKSEIAFRPEPNSTTDTKVNYDFQKIDVPVLLGKKFLGVAHAFIGPSFQYIIDGDLDWDKVKSVETDGFTVGLQMGAGVELGSLGLDVRWERGFSDTESEFITKETGAESQKFDTRVNQIVVGLSYKF